MPVSPGARSDTLEKEVRFLSDIRDVIVNPDLQQRKILVYIQVKGEHKIRLLMVFPPNYPQGEAPTFLFDASTTLDKTTQVSVMVVVLSCTIFYHQLFFQNSITLFYLASFLIDGLQCICLSI